MIQSIQTTFVTLSVMLPLTFLPIFVFVLFQSTKAMIDTKSDDNFQEELKNELDNGAAVFVLSGCVTLDGDFCKLSGSDLMSAWLLQKNKNFLDNSEIRINTVSSTQIVTGIILNFYISFKKSFSVEDECKVEDVEKIYVFSTKAVQQYSSFFFRGCRIFKKGDKIERNEVYLALTQGTSEPTSLSFFNILSKKTKNLKIRYFDQREFETEQICNCNGLEFYVSSSSKIFNVIVLIVLLAGLVSLFCQVF